jgi:hypothetical protein
MEIFFKDAKELIHIDVTHSPKVRSNDQIPERP